VKFNPFAPTAGFDLNPSGAFLTSSSDKSTGLITACGHTYEHWLH